MSEKTVYIPLRIPESLKAQVENLAKQDSRSFNSYVKVLLEKHITEKGGK